MFTKDANKVSFLGVAIIFILSGATILALGLVMWLFNVCGDASFSIPSSKVIGGLVILALGYIVLELELLRKK